MAAPRAALALVLLCAVGQALGRVQGAQGAPGKPHLHGIFVAPTAVTGNWSQAQWVVDVRAMAAINLSFLCLDPIVRQVGPPTDGCPLGSYEVQYPSQLDPGCFQQVGTTAAGGVVGNVVRAAREVGLQVHFGLALQEGNASYARTGNTTTLREYAWLQWTLAQELWQLFGSFTLGPAGEPAGKPRPVVAGYYTVIEEANSVAWFERLVDLAGHYLEPLSADIKLNLSSDLLVWASPYSVGNTTRFDMKDFLEPRLWGDFWHEMFRLAPHFDLIAPQDSMGAQGNSFQNASDFLSGLANGSTTAGRRIWSNVELFEAWPPSCQWPDECHGRHPGPWDRIEQQMANEGPLTSGGVMIAWEWYSCLSPNGGADLPFSNVSRQRYHQYSAYLHGNSTERPGPKRA